MFCDQGSSVVSTNPLQLPNLRFPWVKEMHPANINDAPTSHSPFTQPCSSTAKKMKAPGSIPSLSKSRNHPQVNRLASLKRTQKCGTLHDFACHPCAGAMLIFSLLCIVPILALICAAEAGTLKFSKSFLIIKHF